MNIFNSDQIISINHFGAMKNDIYFIYDKCIINVQCGCFKGGIHEFENKIKETSINDDNINVLENIICDVDDKDVLYFDNCIYRKNYLRTIEYVKEFFKNRFPN